MKKFLREKLKQTTTTREARITVRSTYTGTRARRRAGGGGGEPAGAVRVATAARERLFVLKTGSGTGLQKFDDRRLFVG